MEPDNEGTRDYQDSRKQVLPGRRLYLSVCLAEVLNGVDFLLSPTDTRFLARYVKERCPSPEK